MTTQIRTNPVTKIPKKNKCDLTLIREVRVVHNQLVKGLECLERVTRPVTVQYMLRDYVKILECQPLQQATNDVPITFNVYGSACFKSNENFKQAEKKAVTHSFI